MHVPLPTQHAAGATAPHHGAPRSLPPSRPRPGPLLVLTRLPLHRPQVWGEAPSNTKQQQRSSLGRRPVHFHSSRSCVTLLLNTQGEVSADPGEGRAGGPCGVRVNTRPSRPHRSSASTRPRTAWPPTREYTLTTPTCPSIGVLSQRRLGPEPNSRSSSPSFETRARVGGWRLGPGVGGRGADRGSLSPNVFPRT